MQPVLMMACNSGVRGVLGISRFTLRSSLLSEAFICVNDDDGKQFDHQVVWRQEHE